MQSKQTLLQTVAGGLVMLAAVSVNAAPIVYFGQDAGLGESTRLTTHLNSDAARASFLGGLTGVGTETFESQANGAGAPLSVSFPGSSGSITATLSGDGNIANVPSGTNGFGRYPISGSQYWETGSAFGISFSAPVAAFGFYGVDIGDFGGQVTLTFAGGGSGTFNVGNCINCSGGGVLYWGIIDAENLFTSIAFGNTASGTDYFAFDDFTIGSREQVTVPEPGIVALFGLGLLGLVSLRRRALA